MRRRSRHGARIAHSHLCTTIPVLQAATARWARRSGCWGIQSAQKKLERADLQHHNLIALADRACLALGIQRSCKVLTSERRMALPSLSIKVKLIRNAH